MALRGAGGASGLSAADRGRRRSARHLVRVRHGRGRECLRRDAIGRFGITPQAIDDTLYDAFGQRQVATIFGELNQRRVILEVTPSYQEDASSLQKLYVRSTTTGQLVPLSALRVLFQEYVAQKPIFLIVPLVLI